MCYLHNQEEIKGDQNGHEVYKMAIKGLCLKNKIAHCL